MGILRGFVDDCRISSDLKGIELVQQELPEQTRLPATNKFYRLSKL
jgi:hypothetical protein